VHVEGVVHPRVKHRDAEGLIPRNESNVGDETRVEHLIDRDSVVSPPLRLPVDTDPIIDHRFETPRSLSTAQEAIPEAEDDQTKDGRTGRARPSWRPFEPGLPRRAWIERTTTAPAVDGGRPLRLSRYRKSIPSGDDFPNFVHDHGTVGGSRSGNTVDSTREDEGKVSDFVIETYDITKLYGDNVAVDNLNLRVRRGEVYGFLGPNGAGKTTTLRMLLGLAKPTSGGASVLGGSPGSSESIARIGALVETPGFYPGLSGRDNLRVLAHHSGAPRQSIEVVLDQVGLVERARDHFDTYSQGMKQRLGVAAALLKDPELLILDEPTNGLDPAGIAEMRSFIRELGRGRRTVLLSSHLMTEVEQICDRAGVISRGALVKEGTVDELRGGDILRVVAKPLEKARRLVEGVPGVEAVATADGALRITTDLAAAPAINHALVTAGIAVSELGPDRTSLEEVFLELTRRGKEDE
jgi:ABC-type multidrug transport system ATPase subunit